MDKKTIEEIEELAHGTYSMRCDLVNYALLQDARIDELEAEIRRAFDMLGLHGVPEGRAGTVANGIDVLATRYRKDFDSLRYELTSEREKELKMYDALGGILEDDSPYVSLQDKQSRWKDRMEVARDAVQSYEDYRKITKQPTKDATKN